MAKIKYVQLEPAAFLADFVGLTPEQRGSYATICFKLYDGSISADPKSLAVLCATTTERFQNEIWPAISHKFSITNGLLTHKRVTKELKIAKEHHKKRQNAANKRWGKADAKHIQSNANQNQNQNQNQKGNNNQKKKPKERVVFAPPTISQINEYCKEKNIYVDAKDFIDFYANKDWEIGKTGKKMKDWRLAANRAVKWECNRDKQPPLKADPKLEAERLEKRRREVKAEYSSFYQEQTTEKLKKMLTETQHRLRHWLIAEILAERAKK